MKYMDYIAVIVLVMAVLAMWTKTLRNEQPPILEAHFEPIPLALPIETTNMYVGQERKDECCEIEH